MGPFANNLDAYQDAYRPEFPYYEDNLLMLRAYGERVAKAIRKTGARRVLSLGIGHSEVAGRIMDELITGNLQHYCIVEGSAGILDDFRARHSPLPQGLDLLHGYFESFTPAGRFDLIEAGFVMEHVDDPAVVLRRIKDFLADAGRIFIAVPNARSLHRLLGHMAGMLPDMYALSEADLALGHQRYFDRDSLIELAQQCGYRVVDTWGLLLKPFTTAQLARLQLPATVWDALVRVAEGYPEIANAVGIEAVVA